MNMDRNFVFPLRHTLRGSFWLLPLLLAAPMEATENVPHEPFARWADLPQHGELIVAATYQESEAYHIWASGDMYNVDWRARGEHYGIDVTQGWLSFQYGITERWAADISVGYTTVGWRYFSNFSADGASESTSGLMDTSLGVRYQIFQENPDAGSWTPTLTFRAGAVLPGTFDEDFPFAPGLRSAAIEPEMLLRKHFGWPGLGLYGDGLFRWNRTTANDQYILAVGLFQQIKGWELSAGYRHLGTVSGSNVVLYPDRYIEYPRDPRENNDAIEAGFTYTTRKHRIQIGFFSRVVVDGNNSDQKFWVGGSLQVPFRVYTPH